MLVTLGRWFLSLLAICKAYPERTLDRLKMASEYNLFTRLDFNNTLQGGKFVHIMTHSTALVRF